VQSLSDDSVAMQQALPRRPSYQSAIAELGLASLSGLNVNGLFEQATGMLCDVLGVDYAKVLHQPSAGGPLVLMAGSGWSDQVRVGETTVPSAGRSQAGYTLLSNEPVIVEDFAREKRFAGPQLLKDHGVVSGMSVVIPGPDRPYGVLGVHSRRRRRLIASDSDFLRSVANILGAAVQNDRSREQIELQSRLQEHRARYQSALAECAENLLTSSGEKRLENALQALLAATQATDVFAERNVHHPELGLCSQTVARSVDPDSAYVGHDTYWALVPWERMPTSRSHLEKGEPFFLIAEELEGVEAEQYAEDPNPVKSELDIPIFVDGEWTGLVGFADKDIVREWAEDDVSLLTTAARMIGAFWERELARDHLEQMVQSKGELVASISHELRTPLTAVVGFAQLLQEESSGLSSAKRAEMIQTIVDEGMDLTNIVEDLLAAAKVEAGTLTVVNVSVDLRAQAAQVLETSSQDGAHDIRLNGHTVRAKGDPARVRQILRNLISNALRYGGARIQVEVSGTEATARVLVTDDGPGVPPEDIERIFERYQRAHNTPGMTSSLGLGLTISRQLAHLMDGELTYRYEDGKSIFELLLPKAT
jgi:signal transduction histidine kinase